MGLIGRLNIRRIKDMGINETAYAYPIEALAFDVENASYLNLNACLFKEMTSISCLKITRIGPKKKDYDVNISFLKYDLVRTKQKGNPFPSNFAEEEDVIQLEYNNPLDSITSKNIDEFISEKESS